jgi:hypothetical protein
MSGNGVTNIGPAGSATGYLNNPAYERQRSRQARLRSGVFGNLSFQMQDGDKGENSGTERPGMDVLKSAAIVRVEKTAGDKHIWTMTKQLKGKPTFGDQLPEKGGMLDFLNAEVTLNKVKAPAWQIPADMDLQRLNSVTDLSVEQYQQELKEHHIRWHADRIAHQAISTFLNGASDNLRQPTSAGGRGLDLGRGAGVQVSPLNSIVLGAGKTSGATLAARESSLKTNIGALSTSNSKHLISTRALQLVSEELSTGGTLIEALDIGGEARYICVLPSMCRLQLLGADSTLVDYAKYTAAWGKDSPLLKMSPIEVGCLTILFDNVLSKYAPDVTGSEIVWGKATTDFQSWSYSDLSGASLNRGVGVILGRRAMMEATNKGIMYTTEEGPHESSKEISSYVKDSMQRAMWFDKQDASVMPFDQSSLLLCFAHTGVSFT